MWIGQEVQKVLWRQGLGRLRQRAGARLRALESADAAENRPDQRPSTTKPTVQHGCLSDDGSKTLASGARSLSLDQQGRARRQARNAETRACLGLANRFFRAVSS